MDKATAIIRKVGNKYCVFSKDGSKKLGCYPSEKQAKQRIQQVEYFKSVKGDSMTDHFNPSKFGNGSDLSKSTVPLNIHDRLSTIGTVAGKTSNKILDKREHLPIYTESQAKSAIKRVGQMSESPAWFNGDIDDLQTMVFLAVADKYPEIAIPLEVRLEHAMASLTIDKATKSKDKTMAAKKDDSNSGLDAAVNLIKADKKVKDPMVVTKTKNNVPGVTRPNLKETSAEILMAVAAKDKTMANELIKMLEKQQARLEAAMALAKTLEKEGLSAEDFGSLCGYLQSDILNALLSCYASHTSVAALVAKNRIKGE